MAKPRAPLLSFGASGTIADTLTYASWRGINYVRERVIPQNPKTTEQTVTRDIFSWLSQIWKLSPTLGQAPWLAFAGGKKFTGRNALMGQNVTAMRGDVDLANMVGSPGARGGLAPTSIVAADGVGSSVVTFVQPGVPSGWAIQAAVAIAIMDQDPQTGALFIVIAAEDAITPFDTVTLPGLAIGTQRVLGWTRWLKPDGAIAYGPSLTDTAVIT